MNVTMLLCGFRYNPWVLKVTFFFFFGVSEGKLTHMVYFQVALNLFTPDCYDRAGQQPTRHYG